MTDALFTTLSPVDIVYQSCNESGDRDIEGLIFYKEAELNDRVKGKVPILEVLVKNNITDGISVDEIDTGGDKVQIPVRQGSSKKWARIMRIISQNAAFLKLECK